jgi:hypothetical protein
MSSIVNAVLSMKMDIYKQIDIQDENTGAIKKEWIFDRTVDCHAKGSIGNSSTSRSTDKQVFNNKYTIDQMIQVRTESRLTIREKITNIRNRQNEVIWTEINFPTETPTVFEVVGVTPITDPFGRVLGYNSSMKRSENQIIGI